MKTRGTVKNLQQQQQQQQQQQHAISDVLAFNP